MHPLSKDDYISLAIIASEGDGRLATVLNNNDCANWTVCPECKQDDFSHAVNCQVGSEIHGT